MISKFRNIAMISFLAVAGIFGVSSAVINKRNNEQPVVEKAEAAVVNSTARIYLNIGDWDPNPYEVRAALDGSNWSGLYKANVYEPTYSDLSYSTATQYFVIDTTATSSNSLLFYFKQGINWVNYQWVPDWDGERSRQKNCKWGDTFNAGTIYKIDISQSGAADEVNHYKWFSWTGAASSVVGYFLNYDYKGGTAATGTKSHQEYLTGTGSATLQTAPTKSGSTFLGWKRSDTGAIIAAGESITDVSSSITLTAQWDTYVYYVTASASTTGDYIYSWGADTDYGSFPGSPIASVGVDVTGVVRFEGNNIKIYKIPIPSDTNFKFDNGTSDYQSGNFTVTNGGAYWWGSSTANTDAGMALDLIFAEEEARNAVSAHGTIKNYSICGIASSRAASLVKTYNEDLTTEARRLVNTSTTKTYDGTSSDETQVGFDAIFNQLSKIASSGSKSAIRNFALGSLFDDDNNVSTIIIIAASSVALLSVTALSILVIKKRKNKEE